MAKAIKLPSSDAAKADLLHTTREQRLALQKQVDKLKETETALSEYFINNYDKRSNGIAGKIARVEIKTKSKPTVEDWDAFYKHLAKTGEFDLMQRRVSDGAIEERWEHGKKVPGIGKMQVKSVSCTKLK